MKSYKFIDLFAGCGGFSLGLSMAGLQGRFAIERDPMAFATFQENFLGERGIPVAKFDWPYWLKKQAWNIDDLLKSHYSELKSLRGEIDVLAGGPPCQGFSFAGKRNEADPRNQLFQKYVDVVSAVNPMALILENVPGMKVAHISKDASVSETGASSESYYEKLKKSLYGIGYVAVGRLVDASGFGVPQRRVRLIVIGLRKDVAASLLGGVDRIFDILEEQRIQQLKDLKLPKLVTAKDAINDLLTYGRHRQLCSDPYSPPGFLEVLYKGPEINCSYQKLMHKGCRTDSMDSMRLAKHGDVVRARFELILKECPKGVRMDESFRAKYGIKKHRVHPMAKYEPAPTITTLPDDILHYEEPRILTVRESARIQSFPDWFRFRGKFTTGGKQRTKECPRYTQVGNAVPPLLARAIGLAVSQAIMESEDGRSQLQNITKLVRADKSLLVA